MVYREGIRHRIGRGISLFHTLIGWDYPEHINNQQSSSLLDQVSSICDITLATIWESVQGKTPPGRTK
jgi:hypothetical protein